MLEKKAFSDAAGLIVPAALLVLFLSSPDDVVRIGSTTLDFCFRSVFPSLLPFMAASSLLASCDLRFFSRILPSRPFRTLFGVPPSCFPVLLLGFVSGFPVGARTAAEMVENGSCTKTEGEKLVSFCNNASPAFVLSAVGASMFGDVSAGVLLFLSQTASALLCGVLVPRFFAGKKEESAFRPEFDVSSVRSRPFFSSVVYAVSSSAASLVPICGFLVFFSVLAGLMMKFGVFSLISGLLCSVPFLSSVGKETLEAILSGLVEFSSGLRLASSLEGIRGVAASAFILGFSGFSVHCQVASCVSGNGMSLRSYFASKCLGAFVSAAFSVLFFMIFK